MILPTQHSQGPRIWYREKQKRIEVLYVIVSQKSTEEGARLWTNSCILIKDAEIGHSMQASKLKK